MDHIRLAHRAAVAHASIAIAGFLAAVPGSGGGGFLVYAVLAPAVPLVTVWAGSRLATSDTARTALAGVMVLSAICAAATAILVAVSNEPMAPIFLILFALWHAAIMALLLLARAVLHLKTRLH